MKKESIFPVEIYEFYNKDVAAECLKLFKEEPTWKNDNVPTGVKTCKSVETNPKYQFMMDWFQSCFDEIAEDLALECDSLKANKAWGNWSPAWSGWYHSAHRHAMSYYSGVFYLTDGPPTYFVDPVQQREWNQQQKFDLTKLIRVPVLTDTRTITLNHVIVWELPQIETSSFELSVNTIDLVVSFNGIISETQRRDSIVNTKIHKGIPFSTLVYDTRQCEKISS